MAEKNIVRAITIASFDSADLQPATWQAVTPAGGLPKACFSIIITNDSDRAVKVSYDSTNTQDFVQTMEGASVDSNSILNLTFGDTFTEGQVNALKKGTVISFKGGVNGTGLIYLSGYYQE